MAIKPVVRYMLLCEDWSLDPENSRRITIHGLISNIRALEDPPYPLLYREMCVFLALSEVRGSGEIRLVCFSEEGEETVFDIVRTISFGTDPLEVVGVPFRFRNITFPKAGVYSAQLYYDGELVEERTLRLR
jgi:hypothetical protein